MTNSFRDLIDKINEAQDTQEEKKVLTESNASLEATVNYVSKMKEAFNDMEVADDLGHGNQRDYEDSSLEDDESHMGEPHDVQEIKKRANGETTASIPEEKLLEIAKKYFNIETLKTRNSDHLDFHDCSVWGIKRALEAAYLAGKGTGKE
jgi:hypothetical protein